MSCVDLAWVERGHDDVDLRLGLLEDRRGDVKDQQNDQDVDQRDDVDDRRAARFPGELHGNQACSAVTLGLRVELAEQFRAKRFEVDGQRLDVAGEKAVGDEGRDGDEQAGDGAVHGLGDAGGDLRALGGEIGGVAGGAEDADEAEDGAHADRAAGRGR